MDLTIYISIWAWDLTINKKIEQHNPNITYSKLNLFHNFFWENMLANHGFSVVHGIHPEQVKHMINGAFLIDHYPRMRESFGGISAWKIFWEEFFRSSGCYVHTGALHFSLHKDVQHTTRVVMPAKIKS